MDQSGDVFDRVHNARRCLVENQGDGVVIILAQRLVDQLGRDGLAHRHLEFIAWHAVGVGDLVPALRERAADGVENLLVRSLSN